MKQNIPATHGMLTTLLAASSVVGLAWAEPSRAADPAPRNTVLLSGLQPAYPERCAGIRKGRTGLCLLVAVTPAPSGAFRLRPIVPGSAPTATDQAVPRNRVLALAPGEYELYKSSGIDQHQPARITVRKGRVSLVKTATLQYHAARNVTYKIQRFQPAPGTNNGGCLAEFVTAGAQAYLPGNFLLNQANGQQTNPRCELGGVTFNAVSGQGYTVRSGQVTEQVLTAADTYLHPNRRSALTSIAPAMHGIGKIGWLSTWRSHRGIPNPNTRAHAALALYGPGSYTYLVPFTFRANANACGLSLAQGLMPQAKLLTDCTFQDGYLTGFTVNEGSYFTYHNLYGLPGIAANKIRNRFKVANVQFALPQGN